MSFATTWVTLGYYAMRNKLIIERQILPNSTYINLPNRAKFTRSHSGMVAARGQEEGQMESYYLKGINIQLIKINKLWRSALQHCTYS